MNTIQRNVYPIISSLSASHLNDDDDMNTSVKKCQKVIGESFEKRFQIGNEKVLVLAASALNPLHKRLSMFAAEKQQEVKLFLQAEVSKIRQPAQTQLDESNVVTIKEEPDSPSRKKVKVESEDNVHAMKFLMGDYFEIDSDEDDDEVDSYFSEKRSKIPALDW